MSGDSVTGPELGSGHCHFPECAEFYLIPLNHTRKTGHGLIVLVFFPKQVFSLLLNILVDTDKI